MGFFSYLEASFQHRAWSGVCTHYRCLLCVPRWPIGQAMKKHGWLTLTLQFMSSRRRPDTDFLHRNEEEQDLVVKDILGFETYFSTDFLNGHTGKSLSQSTTISTEQHVSPHSTKYQPHTAPTDQPKLKTELKESSDLGVPPTGRYHRPGGSSQPIVKTESFV